MPKEFLLHTPNWPDARDENAAKQIQRAFEEMDIDVIIKPVDKKDESFQLDPNLINIAMCSAIVFNDNVKYLEKLVENASKLNDPVVFLVEKILYEKVDIEEAFRKENPIAAPNHLNNGENIVVIKDYSWEDTGINSLQAQTIAESILKEVENKEKQLANINH